MRESIACTGRRSTIPYCFKETGISIFSYEELCYYLSQHMICYLYAVPEEDLLLYIRDELGLENLYHRLWTLMNSASGPEDYFRELFREGSYFSEEEIWQILDEHRQLRKEHYGKQCKHLGDLMLKSSKATRAIVYYEEALRKGPGSEEGRIYHNLGIAQMRLFRFSDASLCFLKAYQFSKEEEPLYYYYCTIALTQSIEAARREMVALGQSELVRETFEDRFSELKEQMTQTEDGERLQRIRYLRENGREEEAKDRKRRLVRRMQLAFRQEMEVGQALRQTDTPQRIDI